MTPRLKGCSLGTLLLIALLVAACDSSETEANKPAEKTPSESSTPPPSAKPDDGAIRDDVACDLESLGADEATEFLTVHYVVDGELGAVCYGEEDESLHDAWEQLALITPPGQLNDLFLFAGFNHESSEEEDETYAFVNAADDEGSGFQMSINLDAYDADSNEAALTLAHEFSHVFTSTETQLDRSVESDEECPTYYNAEGCFLPDSVIYLWIQRFWGDGLIDQIDVNAEPNTQAGETRCSLDARFLGPYAASNPEEDFAEAFSAFVFQVGPVTDEVQAKFNWLAEQPGLAEFRDRAIEAELGPLDNNFEPCGE